MAVDNMLVNDYVALTTTYPGNRQKNWNATAIVSAQRNNIFADMEGKETSLQPVVRKDDFAKTKGDKIVFTTIARLGGRARRGSEVLVGKEEKTKVGTFELQIDIRRHATGMDEKHKLLSAIELEGYQAALLGDHAGWTQECDMMMTLRNLAQNNVVRGGDKGSRELLRSADVVTPSLIQTAAEVARSNMAKPCRLTTSKAGYTIPRYMFVSPHPALTAFKNTSQYLQAVEYAGERGEMNPLFRGEFADWDGHIIYPHFTEDDDSNGPVGSAFAPKAYLGTAIAAGTTAIDIIGGGNAAGGALTDPLYFGFFSNYDWIFAEGQTPAPDTTDRYAIIYNLTGGSAGKWGFYRFRTNNGNKLTMHSAASRLAAASSGVAATTVGNVTWDGSLNTDAHPEGSLIVETNSYGVPFGFSVLLGAQAIMRGYGKNPIKKIQNSQDYEYSNAQGYQTTYGQTPYKDTNGNVKRYVLVEHAIQYAGIKLPVI